MIGPPISFDEKGQNIGIPSAAVQNRNQHAAVVLPASSGDGGPGAANAGAGRAGCDRRCRVEGLAPGYAIALASLRTSPMQAQADFCVTSPRAYGAEGESMSG